MTVSAGTFFLSQVNPPRADLHAAPGQFLLATPPTLDPYLPRIVWPFHLRAETVDSVLLPPDATNWARSEQLQLRGPYGHPFTIPDQPLRAIVLAADTLGGAQMLTLIEALVARECEVTVLCAPDPWIEGWLPPEVEYREVEQVLTASADLVNWADRLYACGSPALYDALYDMAHTARLAFAHGWGEILCRNLPMPCGIGLCYLCACKTRRGVILNCKEGPVIDLADWQSEA
ncbi:MAG: hypothetical protein WCF84_19730 [Anaerolineae bacterium]